MKSLVARATFGVFALGLALSGTAALGQTAVGTPPAKDALPTFEPLNRVVVPKVEVDPETGQIFEISAKVAPTLIPFDGVFPDGTFPQPDREAGRPMRPHHTPWIPDGSGYWPPLSDDLAGPAAQPVMQGFEAIGPNGLTPPDPDLARGYDYEVAVTNDDFAVYDSCGTELFRRDINDYLGISDFMFDPKVIFDPWAGRWVMMYHVRENSPQKSSLVVVVTGDSTPFGLPGSSVWFYNFNMVQDAGTGNASWLDYADLGYSNTQLFASGNMFKFSGGFRWARLIVFDKAEIYAQVAASRISWSNLSNPDGSTTDTPRSVKMQASWSESGNIDAYFANSRAGGGNRITFWKVRDAFGANTLTKTDTVVGNYTTPPDAVQPSGGSLDTIDCRLMTAIATTDTLGGGGIETFTGMTANRSGNAGVLLYKFDSVGNGLEFESLFGASGFDYWFPCSASDYSGSNFWVFSRTANSSGNEPEIRFVDYDQGTFSGSSAQIRDGDGSFNGFRWGDYFGGQLDWGDYSANISIPGRPAKVWLYAQYGEVNSWNTYVGATSVFPQGTISSVTPSGTWNLFGPPGGPFTPSAQVYTIASASGDVGTAFQVESLPSWLDASQVYGPVYANTSVTLSVNSNANGLGLGTYADTVVFDDCFRGQGQFNRVVQLNVQGIDLEVVSINVPNGTYNPGDTINPTGQYRNNGNLATRSFTANFYASENQTITEFDTLIGTRGYGALAAGATLNFSHNLTLPCMPEDDYYIGVIITVSGDVDTSDNVNHDTTPIQYSFCPGDFNGDCAVNTQDVLSFLNAWNANDPSADCNNDGNINTQDVLCFLNLWTGGC
ncbi:MAG: GC-type dockerin domain-anchored protein [Planctomycetota bacterium]|nr:GC-type dockerin domain-anchored protein [Planctomycetota bacterium]